MPRLHTKQELSALAQAVSASMSLVSFMGNIYEARDFETGAPLPPPNRAVWIELTHEDLKELAKSLDILFSSPTEFMSFQYMIGQGADLIKKAEPFVVIRHNDGLAYLTDVGLVNIENPGFTPNFINHRIIEKTDKDYEHVEKLYKIISNWVGGDRQADSLLNHLATALQPSWSAVKYVLLLGEGRNGKGTLLSMLHALLGKRNVSNVTRQMIASLRPPVAALNGKLANIVFDGPVEYVKESGPEKTLTAGEPLNVEMKFENVSQIVQTTALFIEGLNREPKARDRSGALQRRLVRFNFPNEYDLDIMFARTMTSELMLDALLTLLWEHWVTESEIVEKLRLSDESMDLQMTVIMDRSPILAFIEETAQKNPKFLEQLMSGTYQADTFIAAYQPWIQSQGYGERTVTDIWDSLADHFILETKVKREANRGPVRRKYLSRVKTDTLRALKIMEGSLNDEQAMVRGE